MRFNTTSLGLLMSSIALITACSTPVPPAPPVVIEKNPEPVKTQPDTRVVKEEVAPTIDPLNDPKGVLSKRSVYFDFDSYAVKEEFTGLVGAHSKYLVNNKARKILIQGNTDERGGREYNLALGQKRAEAVRKSMTLLSVPESQIEAVSLGKEKPKATGSDEASWAENRRADIVYQ